MVRVSFAVVCAAGALAAGGCTKMGGYTATWSFASGEASVGCGAHGVDAIRITGASMEGDGDDVSAVCADGKLTRGVPVGTWTFMFHQLDVRGREIVVLDANGQPMPNQTASVTIAQDQTPALDPVVLAVRPECSDGVDNDGDGRVDLDDPDCGNDLNGTSELPSP